jgi:DNA-binding MarR family transcriptional regulator
MLKIRKPAHPLRSGHHAPQPGVSPELNQANYEALADFRFALRKFLAFSEAAAKEAGLAPQQHQALLTIKGAASAGTVGIQLLSARLLIHHNTAVELVDRLVEGGLVKRSRDADDRRRAVLQLTAKADRLLKSLSVAHLQELQAARPALLKLLKQLD